MAAYSVLCSQLVSQDDLAAFLAPWAPEPSYEPDGSVRPGWFAFLIEEPLLLHIYLEEPDELPDSLLHAASQILGAPVASNVAMFSFERPGTPVGYRAPGDDWERHEREGLRINALERDLVWWITWNFGTSWPAVLSDHTGTADRERWYLGLLGREDSIPPWTVAAQERAASRPQQRSRWRDLFS